MTAYLKNVFLIIDDERRGNPGGCHKASYGSRYRGDLCIGNDIGSLRVPEGCDVFQPLCILTDIGNEVQKIQDRGKSKPAPMPLRLNAAETAKHTAAISACRRR